MALAHSRAEGRNVTGSRWCKGPVFMAAVAWWLVDVELQSKVREQDVRATMPLTVFFQFYN